MSVRETMQALKAHADGLSADEVMRRQAREGANALPRERAPGWPVVFARQFGGPLMLILLVAAVVSLALGDLLDAAVIAGAVGLNAVVGFFQEYQASRTLERLRDLVQPRALVRRNGRAEEIPAEQVVPGDILLLRAGDRMAADARVIVAFDLETNESSLTGESLPTRKGVAPVQPGTPLAERASMVFAGTSVAEGQGEAVVVGIGLRTELGNIAELVQRTEDGSTPLQAELARLARFVSALVLVIIAGSFAIGVARGIAPIPMLETSIALAVAAIPEGLAVAITVVLAVGMQRIFRRGSLVRRLVAAETLGSVNVICTDKTGTLTLGEMRVQEVLLADGAAGLGDPLDADEADDRRLLFQIGMLCNDAVVDGDGSFEPDAIRGTPTERALLLAAVDLGLDPREDAKRFPRRAEVPFDSTRKVMATLHDAEDGKRHLFVKGAPERVLSWATRERARGHDTAMDPEAMRRWKRRVTDLTERGLRVLAFAYRSMPSGAQTLAETDLSELTLVGLVALQDPLRPEAAASVREAALAGVRTIMITGDHPKTALAIARAAGVSTGDERVATGDDLDRWDDAELRRRVTGIDVFARVEPKHKLRIVQAWHAHDAVVAMTGDGVNDAPALRAADVGVALGSGTEVAKEASDLVLLDNNLSTITAAINEGRVIFDNIRKIVVYLMADSFTEIILITGALLFGLPAPLLPAQILWINLIADSLPNAALTLEPGEPDVMDLPPRPRAEPIVNREMLTLIFVIGVITDVVLFLLYVGYLHATGDVERARTIVFAAVGIDSLLYVFALKSFRRSLLAIRPFSNPWLVLGVACGFALMAVVLFFPPLRKAFDAVPLRLSDIGLLLIMGVIKLVAIEATKRAYRRPTASSRSSTRHS